MDKLIVFLQLLFIIFIYKLANIEKLLKNPILIFIMVIGAIIGLSGFFIFNKKSFSIFPHPKTYNELTNKGIYSYIRHPMYLGIIFIAFSLLLSNLTTLSLIVFLFLIAVLDFKASVEEKYLKKIHKEYKEYIKTTKRFIPFIY